MSDEAIQQLSQWAFEHCRRRFYGFLPGAQSHQPHQAQNPSQLSGGNTFPTQEETNASHTCRAPADSCFKDPSRSESLENCGTQKEGSMSDESFQELLQWDPEECMRTLEAYISGAQSHQPHQAQNPSQLSGGNTFPTQDTSAYHGAPSVGGVGGGGGNTVAQDGLQGSSVGAAVGRNSGISTEVPGSSTPGGSGNLNGNHLLAALLQSYQGAPSVGGVGGGGGAQIVPAKCTSKSVRGPHYTQAECTLILETRKAAINGEDAHSKKRGAGADWALATAKLLDRNVDSVQWKMEGLKKGYDNIRDYHSNQNQTNPRSYFDMTDKEKRAANLEREKLKQLPLVYPQKWFDMMEEIEGGKTVDRARSIAVNSIPPSPSTLRLSLPQEDHDRRTRRESGVMDDEQGMETVKNPFKNATSAPGLTIPNVNELVAVVQPLQILLSGFFGRVEPIMERFLEIKEEEHAWKRQKRMGQERNI